MRILLANGHRSILGGVETHLRSLIPLLRARGHEIALLHEVPAENGAAVVDEGASEIWAPCAARTPVDQLLGAVREWQPDVVYTHGLHSAGLEAGLVEAFPAAFFGHGYYGTCATGSKLHRRPDVQPCSRAMGPSCLALNYLRGCGGLSPVALWRYYRLQLRRRALLGRYGAVMVASRHMLEEYSHHGVQRSRLQLAPLFPPGQKPAPEAPPRRGVAGRLLYVGRLTVAKGARLLADTVAVAAALLGRPLSLTVMGDGPERTWLEHRSQELGIRAEFRGWVDGPERDSQYREADLLLLPSIWPEPYGLVGLEAACFGLPSAAFPVGGIRDWLVPERTGVFASSGQMTARNLAKAVARVLADPDHLERLRRGAWKESHRVSSDTHVLLVESVLKALREK